MVGDHPRENVEPASGAFRIAAGGDRFRQRQPLQQRHDIDAAGFQHGAVAKIDLMQGQIGKPLGDPKAGTGQEAGAHPKGAVAESQVETGRLNLGIDERLGRQQLAGIGKRANGPVRQDSLAQSAQRDGPFGQFGPFRSRALADRAFDAKAASR